MTFDEWREYVERIERLKLDPDTTMLMQLRVTAVRYAEVCATKGRAVDFDAAGDSLPENEMGLMVSSVLRLIGRIHKELHSKGEVMDREWLEAEFSKCGTPKC